MVIHIRPMDFGRYRYNNKGFCENFIFLKSINRRRTIIIEVPCKPSQNSPLSSLHLMVMSVQEEI